MAESDHSLAILHLCNENLNSCIRTSVFTYFEDKLDDIIKELKEQDIRKDKIARKAQRKFQFMLRDITKDEDTHASERLEFEKLILKDCSYISELLQQITKLQILLLSKIRKSNDEAIEIDKPDVSMFCRSVLLQNCKSIFHNVEEFYQCYIRKNQSIFSSIIDQNNQGVLHTYLRDAYTSFFKTPKSTPIDKAIYKSILDGAVSEDRVVPDIPPESPKEKNKDISEVDYKEVNLGNEFDTEEDTKKKNEGTEEDTKKKNEGTEEATKKKDDTKKKKENKREIVESEKTLDENGDHLQNVIVRESDLYTLPQYKPFDAESGDDELLTQI